MKEFSKDFYLHEDESLTALFVNTWRDPDKSEPLNHYKYVEGSGGPEFSQLYKDTYVIEDGNKGYHQTLTWKPIETKVRCTAALKQLIDSMDAVTELIIAEDAYAKNHKEITLRDGVCSYCGVVSPISIMNRVTQRTQEV